MDEKEIRLAFSFTDSEGETTNLEKHLLMVKMWIRFGGC